MLFAMPEDDRISQRESDFIIPSEWLDLHKKSLTRLYCDLPVNEYANPKKCVIDPAGWKLLDHWRARKDQSY